MSRRPGPPFLERHRYRLRRRADAVRILPIIGALLFMMPLLWAVDRTDASEAPLLAGQAVYLFAVWFGLVFAAAILGRGLAGGAGSGDDGAGD